MFSFLNLQRSEVKTAYSSKGYIFPVLCPFPQFKGKHVDYTEAYSSFTHLEQQISKLYIPSKCY